MLTLASLFDGISGFPLAAKRAGIETVWSAEIEPQCRSVSARHFPDAIQINNVIAARAMLETKTRGRFATELSRSIDVLCGGFPCQDLSVAGRRAGLAGSRSGLWFVFRRILGIVRPRWVCIENVPGLLSSNEGRDMRVIADAMGQLGYGWAMRVLDAKWCGVPQRRRRVFIVGCLGDGRRAAEILFEPNCLPWDSPPSREARTRVAARLTAGVAASSGVNRPGRRREDDFNLVANCLDAHLGMGGVDDNSAQANHLVPVLSHALTATATATATGRLDPNGETFIPIAFAQNQRDEVRDLNNLAGAIAAEPGMKQQTYIAYQCHGSNVGEMGTLRAGNGNESGGVPFIPFAIQGRAVSENLTNGPQGKGYQEGIAYTLEARSKVQATASRYGVRRLTPLECERLQGFPSIQHLMDVKLCLDNPESCVNVEIRSHKWHEFASTAAGEKSPASALFATLNSSVAHLDHDQLAQRDVLILSGERAVAIHNRERFHWFANSAERSRWYRLFTLPGDFAAMLAGLSLTVDRTIQAGAAALLPSGRSSTLQQSGVLREKIFGGATMQLAKDAMSGSVTTGGRLTRCITAFRSNTPTIDSHWTTWFCSVLAAMTGCIPARTVRPNSLRFLLCHEYGWTRYGHDGREMSDSARYRMLGNSVAVPCVEWFMRRIAERSI